MVAKFQKKAAAPKGAAIKILLGDVITATYNGRAVPCIGNGWFNTALTAISFAKRSLGPDALLGYFVKTKEKPKAFAIATSQRSLGGEA